MVLPLGSTIAHLDMPYLRDMAYLDTQKNARRIFQQLFYPYQEAH